MRTLFTSRLTLEGQRDGLFQFLEFFCEGQRSLWLGQRSRHLAAGSMNDRSFTKLGRNEARFETRGEHVPKRCVCRAEDKGMEWSGAVLCKIPRHHPGGYLGFGCSPSLPSHA